MEVGHARRGEKSATPIITGPANMSNQRLVILAVGVLLVIGGLFALRFPVFLGDFDQWGFQINCGSGFQSALTQAVIADSAGTHFVDRCHTALATRRGWTIALPVTGALLVSALLIRPRRQRRSNFPREAARQSTSLPHVRRLAEKPRRA
jgi:hypothetical protein